jgi:hypothetical protein
MANVFGKTPKPDSDYAYRDGQYEWSTGDGRIKRAPANPNNGSFDGGRENPSWLDGEDKLGPIPRRKQACAFR